MEKNYLIIFQVDIFSIRILLNQLKITECGMFELDLKMIQTVCSKLESIKIEISSNALFFLLQSFSTILSYLVILIQFELGLGKKKSEEY